VGALLFFAKHVAAMPCAVFLEHGAQFCVRSGDWTTLLFADVALAPFAKSW
jgi:hypothetical protein